MKTRNEKPQGLLAKLKTPVDSRPPGWKTFDELLAEDPMPKTTARDLLNNAVAAGEVETAKLKSPTKKGFAIRLNYREKS